MADDNLILPLGKPQPGERTLSLRCRGDSAGRLFEAMSKVGKQESATGVVTRTSDNVQCFRFSGQAVSNECVVTIGVGASFRDAL